MAAAQYATRGAINQTTVGLRRARSARPDGAQLAESGEEPRQWSCKTCYVRVG